MCVGYEQVRCNQKSWRTETFHHFNRQSKSGQHQEDITCWSQLKMEITTCTVAWSSLTRAQLIDLMSSLGGGYFSFWEGTGLKTHTQIMHSYVTGQQSGRMGAREWWWRSAVRKVTVICPTTMRPLSLCPWSISAGLTNYQPHVIDTPWYSLLTPEQGRFGT